MGKFIQGMVFLFVCMGCFFTQPVSSCFAGGAGPTVTLTANPLTINAGQSTTLSWTSRKADLVLLDDDGDGITYSTVALNGSLDVKPAQTTTYNIKARGTTGCQWQSKNVPILAK